MGFMCKCRYRENGELVLEWKNFFGRELKMLYFGITTNSSPKTSIFFVAILNNFKV